MQYAAVIDHITDWLRDYCHSAGMDGFVVGVSGGIDSAVTSALCARTGLPVLALSMPLRQAADQHDLSQQHCQWLQARYPQVTSRTISLGESFASIEAAFDDDVSSHRLAMANSRARLRMLTLYAHAGAMRALVAGTGNKVEDFGVGFYTKYGDGGVDVSPIADLMKTEVYALAAELGVLQAIQDAAPTDGLWDDERTDEGQLGASYAELEWAMRFEEAGGDAQQCDPRQREVLATYRRFHQANLHKMEPIPVCMIPAALR